MKQLYLARDRIEAQLLKDFLARRHIATVLLRDYLAGAAGELPADIAPALWVTDDADLPRARALIDAFLAELRERREAPPWTCTRCGESVDGGFDLCWQCGSGRLVDR